jgi:glycerol-3-phosphate dehydrogenase
MVSPSQGTHLVFDKSFLPGTSAIMVPHTTDGRVLFAIPWHKHVIVGTTDTPIPNVQVEPVPQQQEIDFILEHAAQYLKKDPSKEDILSVFTGIRPLVSDPAAINTATLSRDHVVNTSRSGLLTIAGGKWTTYRKMAQDTLEQAVLIGGLEAQPCITETLQIHGFHKHSAKFDNLEWYGSDAIEIQNLAAETPFYRNRIHEKMEPIEAEVIWAVREEMARTVLDFLSRRRRCLLLNARVSMEMAPAVAKLMAREMGKDTNWQNEQVAAFNAVAQNYLV